MMVLNQDALEKNHDFDVGQTLLISETLSVIYLKKCLSVHDWSENATSILLKPMPSEMSTTNSNWPSFKTK